MEAAFASNWTAGPAHRTLCCGASAWLLPGRSFFGSVAGLQPAPQTIARARLLPRGPGMMAALACSCRRLQLFALPLGGMHAFLFKLSEQIVRTANLDSKLKFEVCVRTGTKFVSEQGLRTPQRESVALALGRTCCVLSPSVARRETSRQEEGRSGATGNVRAPEL